MPDLVAGSVRRSMLNLTAAASTRVPSWKSALGRSLKVYLRWSGDACHDSATSPTNLPSGVMLTSPQPMFIATHIIFVAGRGVEIEVGDLVAVADAERAPALRRLGERR